MRQDLKLDQMALGCQWRGCFSSHPWGRLEEGVCPSQAEADEICGKDLAATVEKACFSLSYQLLG